MREVVALNKIAVTPTDKPRFDIEIDLDGSDVTSYFQGWNFLSATNLVTSGNTLMELIDNASIGTDDQDGGEGPSIMLTDMSEVQIAYHSRLIKDRMEAQRDRR
jgi:hypothetical protein